MVCLDSSFIIDVLRDDSSALKLLDQLEKTRVSIAIPAPVLMEIRSGIALNREGKFEEDVYGRIAGSAIILDLDEHSATRVGDIQASLVLAGEMISATDIMIGAIALANNEPLITRNVKHFSRIPGLRVDTY